jgi:hypothetical protein
MMETLRKRVKEVAGEDEDVDIPDGILTESRKSQIEL